VNEQKDWVKIFELLSCANSLCDDIQLYELKLGFISEHSKSTDSKSRHSSSSSDSASSGPISMDIPNLVMNVTNTTNL